MMAGNQSICLSLRLTKCQLLSSDLLRTLPNLSLILQLVLPQAGFSWKFHSKSLISIQEKVTTEHFSLPTYKNLVTFAKKKHFMAPVFFNQELTFWLEGPPIPIRYYSNLANLQTFQNIWILSRQVLAFSSWNIQRLNEVSACYADERFRFLHSRLDK